MKIPSFAYPYLYHPLPYLCLAIPNGTRSAKDRVIAKAVSAQSGPPQGPLQRGGLPTIYLGILVFHPIDMYKY